MILRLVILIRIITKAVYTYSETCHLQPLNYTGADPGFDQGGGPRSLQAYIADGA